MDAGDSFEDATAISFGNYEGNLSAPGDFADFYMVYFDLGTRLNLSHIGSFGLLTCVQLDVYMPDESLWSSLGCESDVHWMEPPVSGWWFLRFSDGLVPASERPQQPYSFGLSFAERYANGWSFRFDDRRWAMTRVDETDGNMSARVWVPHIPSLEGTSSPQLGLFAVSLKQGWAGGAFLISDMYGSLEPQVSVQAAGIQLGTHIELSQPRVDLGDDAALDYRAGPLGNQGGVVLMAISSAPISGWISVLSTRPHTDQGLMGEVVTAYRIADFPSEISLETPAGGVTLNATADINLSAGFVGFFRTSVLTAPLLEQSKGHFTDPNGCSRSLEAGDFQALLLPPPGRWQFALDEDVGPHGDQLLLFGANIPQGLLGSRVNTIQGCHLHD